MANRLTAKFVKPNKSEKESYEGLPRGAMRAAAKQANKAPNEQTHKPIINQPNKHTNT